MSDPVAEKTPPPPATNENDGASATPGKRRRLLPLLILVVVIAAGVVVWSSFFRTPSVPANIIQLSGRIEGDDSAVAAKTTGRILAVRVREGDQVNAGDVIAELDDAQVRAREEQAQAALLAAESRTNSAKAQIAILQQQLLQNELQTEQSKGDTQGRVSQAEADLAAAQADLAQQEAAYQIALFDKDAYAKLAQSGAVSERQGKQAESTAAQQAAAVAAAKKRVEASRAALTTANATRSNPSIREAAALAVRRQIAEQQSEIATAQANAQQARFQLKEAEDNRHDLTILAPFTGTVITRAAEPGEVITAGTAIITLLDLSKVYLRGFIPEGQIGKVKIGQPGQVYLDARPNQPLDAYVLRIDPQATFTPENTYFRDDRVKEVFGVKLRLKSGIGFAKPGMPADGEILVQGETWPGNRSR
ncbi:MAG TPA: HlyD family efflux transporter periplasmic adaptor subunit [Bryobacteraceae bacterium]|jgi:HlyD family secretion protein|nr:HlyD family efflux transporter periplasmic adaptor subunit [Bryobacteraceae bacterium]